MERKEYTVSKIESYDKVLKILETFDSYFDPCISIKVGDLRNYAKKLHGNAVTVLLTMDHKDAGFVSFYVNHKEIYISLIAVHPEFRRYHLGTVLLNNVESYCYNNNVNYIKLEVDNQNQVAKQFYITNGFVYDSNGERDTQYYVKLLEMESCTAR